MPIAETMRAPSPRIALSADSNDTDQALARMDANTPKVGIHD